MKGEQDVGGISVLLTTAFWCFQPVSVLFAQYSLLESLCIKRKIITLLREYTAVSVLFSQKINCILFFFFWLVTSAILFMLPGLISWIKASIMRLIFASFLLPSARSFSLVQRTFFVCLFVFHNDEGSKCYGHKKSGSRDAKHLAICRAVPTYTKRIALPQMIVADLLKTTHR